MSLTPTDSTLGSSLSASPSTPRASSGRSAQNSKNPPLAPPAPALHSGVATFTHLTLKLEEYLTPSELKKVKEAYRFSDEMHLGQMRKSGEPYISHPLAVA